MPRRLPFDLFRTPSEGRLLTCLVSDTERFWTGTEIRERTGLPTSTFSRIIKRLERQGLIEVQGAGPAKRYRVSKASPLFEPVQELVERTAGVEPLLKQRLEDVPGVEDAVIFGSWSSGESMRPTSDVDVLVIGTADFNDLADIASEIEPIVGRDIQILLYTWDELDERIARDSGFVKNVLKGPLTPLVGDPELLRARLN